MICLAMDWEVSERRGGVVIPSIFGDTSNDEKGGHAYCEIQCKQLQL
jgi:hypothetical protein